MLLFQLVTLPIDTEKVLPQSPHYQALDFVIGAVVRKFTSAKADSNSEKIADESGNRRPLTVRHPQDWARQEPKKFSVPPSRNSRDGH
jgi:hypothetical protein